MKGDSLHPPWCLTSKPKCPFHMGVQHSLRGGWSAAPIPAAGASAGPAVPGAPPPGHRGGAQSSRPHTTGVQRSLSQQLRGATLSNNLECAAAMVTHTPSQATAHISPCCLLPPTLFLTHPSSPDKSILPGGLYKSSMAQNLPGPTDLESFQRLQGATAAGSLQIGEYSSTHPILTTPSGCMSTCCCLLQTTTCSKASGELGQHGETLSLQKTKISRARFLNS